MSLRLKVQSILSGVWVPDIEGTLKQVLSECVDWVFRLLQADLLQSFSEEQNQVVLQVHADVLRLGVEHVFLLLAEHLDVVLRLLLLLLLNYLLQVFFLPGLLHLEQCSRSQRHFVLLSTLALLFFVKGHEVERFLVL